MSTLSKHQFRFLSLNIDVYHSEMLQGYARYTGLSKIYVHLLLRVLQTQNIITINQQCVPGLFRDTWRRQMALVRTRDCPPIRHIEYMGNPQRILNFMTAVTECFRRTLLNDNFHSTLQRVKKSLWIGGPQLPRLLQILHVFVYSGCRIF